MLMLCAPERVLDFTFPVFCGRWKIMKLSQLPKLSKYCVERSLQIALYSLTFNIIDNAMHSTALSLTLTIPILPTYVTI